MHCPHGEEKRGAFQVGDMKVATGKVANDLK